MEGQVDGLPLSHRGPTTLPQENQSYGHANKLSNDYSSTAYYYLSEPKRGGPPLPPFDARLPRPNEETYVPKS